MSPFVPIEFHCPQCQHRLRTPDDSAGKQSRCPQCGHVQAIPKPGRFGADDSEFEPLPAENPFDVEPAATARRPTENPFADAPRSAASNPYAAPLSVSGDAAANPHATILPGAMLIAVAGTSMILLALGLFAGIVTVVDEGLESDDVLAFVFLGFTLAVQFLILWGGINMTRRRGYTMAIVGGIAAIVPLSVCWCLHLPVGVWALIALTRGGMRSVFAAIDR